MAKLTREHLRGLDASRPNRLGGARTHFYAKFAEDSNMSYGATQGGAEVVIGNADFGDKHVLAAKWHGIPTGIHPKPPRKFLTIPANDEAYGRRAREFDLEVSRVAGRLALVKRTSATGKYSTMFKETYRGKNGKMKERILRKKNHGVGDLMFWLIRGTKPIAADPSVLPSVSEYEEAISEAIDRLFRRAR
jgi:hypothetical protein